MTRKPFLLLYATALPACASTLGNISGISGWVKFITLISLPNFLILMIALPFLVASSMKGAAASSIAIRVLICEALAAGLGCLIFYLVFTLN